MLPLNGLAAGRICANLNARIPRDATLKREPSLASILLPVLPTDALSANVILVSATRLASDTNGPDKPYHIRQNQFRGHLPDYKLSKCFR